VAKLTRIDFGGRVGHQIHCPIIFREGHHVADTLFAADQHDQAIESERDSAVWRCAESKRAQQMTKLRLPILRTDPERLEHFLLQLRLVNPYTAAADLDA